VVILKVKMKAVYFLPVKLMKPNNFVVFDKLRWCIMYFQNLLKIGSKDASQALIYAPIARNSLKSKERYFEQWVLLMSDPNSDC
jgi:hypothetical protein